MSPNNRAIKAAYRQWVSSVPHYPPGSELPARGSIGAALVVLEHLKKDFNLDLASHLAQGGAQVRGLSQNALKAILAKFGEKRALSAVGGRTNRGNPSAVARLLSVLRDLAMEGVPAAERETILSEFQKMLVGLVKDFHGRKHIAVKFDPRCTTREAIHEILQRADQDGKAGPVAQYLVGAKLQLRFDDIPIANDQYSAADEQTGRRGDFQIEDTAFHVTVSPTPDVYEKCKRNLEGGCRVYLLVPDEALAGSRQIAQGTAPGCIAVESIESFVATNIEELSRFSKRGLLGGFRRLLEKYNERVEEIESDKSLLIDIPESL